MNAESPSPPHVPAWFQNGFHHFLWPFLRRHFHTIAISRESRMRLDRVGQEPLIVYGNHPSWWDPLVAHFLSKTLFPTRQFYAPIDADALAQYQVFGKLGFYGVRLNTTSGAASFLKQSMAIANAPDTALWITPEGRFADVRDHSATLMPGLAHLCTRLNDGWTVPLVLEYVFWEERLPECLVLIGEPTRIREHAGQSKPDWHQMLTERMRNAQTDLGRLATARSSEPFENLMKGRRGAGIFYDTFRRARAWCTGKSFRAAHGEHFE